MPRSRLIIIGAVFVIGVILVLLFTGVLPGLRAKTSPPVPLTVWGVFDTPETFGLISSAMGPQYTTTYRSFDVSSYETNLINALAAGKGPDVFMIHSSWLPKHFDKLVPASDEQISFTDFQKSFPTVVRQDFAPDGAIYALPLYIDTLALFYNKDHFDSANIAFPPATWTDFQELIPRLRELDASGKIQRAAAAMGGSNRNVNRATDILSAIMLQAGVPMVAPDFSRATFAATGKDTLAFYTKFGNSSNTYYTWSDNFKNSIDGFADGTVSMMLGYAYQIPLLKEKNPFLKFAVAPLPQLAGASQKVSYANYWGLAVSNRSARPQSAWNFIKGATTNPTAVKQYTTAARRIPALLTQSLFDAANKDPELGPFASQILIARSWPQVDSTAIDAIFSSMIEMVLAGQKTLDKALREAEDAVSALMQQNLKRL
jgi:multiple sugar transport system substrate-binding protein